MVVDVHIVCIGLFRFGVNGLHLYQLLASGLEVELIELGTCQLAVDIVHLALIVEVAVGTAAGQGEGTSLAVDGEGDEIVIIDSWSDAG